MYAQKNRCSAAGGCPVTSVATQPSDRATIVAAIDQSDEPDEVRDREDQPEEDGQPPPVEVVVDGEPNRMLVHA